MIAIEFRNVVKTYPEFCLGPINMTVQQGEFFGIFGPPSSGKTSILKLILGLLQQDEGEILLSARNAHEMEVAERGIAMVFQNLALFPHMTGRENIMLRGLYFGLDRRAIEGLAEDVAEFAELTDFLDLPVRIYSSGMVVRLGFALATAVRPQVLLMDEWFLAGDSAFMAKARVRLENLVRGVEILVLSSHLAGIVQQWCTRAIWMDQGRIRADGLPDEVLAQYLDQPAPAPLPPAG